MLSALRRFLPSPRRLAVLFFGIIIPLLIAGEIAEEVLEQERFAFEQPLMLWLHHHIAPAFTPVAVALHYVGKTATAVAISLLFAAYYYARRQRSRAVFVLLGTALPTAVMFVSKQFFDRARPEFWPRIIEETNTSFPSGHSTFAAALATMMVLIYWHSPHRMKIFFAGVIFALLMGFSRVYLGVHYPTDVLVGWINGIATVSAVYFCFFRRHFQP